LVAVTRSSTRWKAAQPDAIIWDTGDLGKPDVLQLPYAAYVESGAEAVICVSNRTVTWQVGARP
jgi:hypothetical protein